MNSINYALWVANMKQNNSTFSNIEKFIHEIEDESSRSLQLLRAIEYTITGVNRLTAQLNADAKYADVFIEKIKLLDGDTAIDPEDSVATSLQKTQSSILNVYNELIARRQSGRDDVRLSEGDGIEHVYTEAISAAADLHNNLNELRWHILEHDADISSSGKAYTDVNELLKNLAS
ncbi:hypothetical protein [Nitrosomonas aestuarii]|nr:hypothetical protein [Nitrosomonas aestuarii]